MDALVTGASGLLGRDVVRSLVQCGYTVVGIYHAHPNWVIHQPCVSHVQCDLTSERAVIELLGRQGTHPRAIIHCASLTDVDRCERDRSLAYTLNVVATRHLVRAAQNVGARLIYVSTASVFPGRRGGETEDDIPDPPNFYSLTKFLAEEIALTCRGSVVVRANILGVHPKRRSGSNLMEWLISTVEKGGDLRLFEDVRINPISSITMAEALARLVALDGGRRILHFGSRDVLSKAAVGRLVIEHFRDYRGRIEEVSVDAGGLDAARPKEMWLDTRKTEHELGWVPPTARAEIERILEDAGLTKPGIA